MAAKTIHHLRPRLQLEWGEKTWDGWHSHKKAPSLGRGRLCAAANATRVLGAARGRITVKCHCSITWVIWGVTFRSYCILSRSNALWQTHAESKRLTSVPQVKVRLVPRVKSLEMFWFYPWKRKQEYIYLTIYTWAQFAAPRRPPPLITCLISKVSLHCCVQWLPRHDLIKLSQAKHRGRWAIEWVH